jgi:hypothetical protein
MVPISLRVRQASPRLKTKQTFGDMIMKALIATALIALGVLSTAVTAQASEFPGYPDWAQQAFENNKG